MDSPILIVGAGPTGLAMALFLQRLGAEFRIIDRNANPARESRALVVQARTLEFYAQLGFADTAIDHGLQLSALNLWSGGSRRTRIVFGEMGRGLSPYPYALILAQDLHERLLVKCLEQRGVRIDRNTELTGFEQRDGHIRAELRHMDGRAETCECAWLIGCDGAHSVVREALGLGFPGGTYEHLFYVADVEASGPVVNGELHVALDESDLLAVFPLPGNRNIRLVGTIRPSAQQQRSQIGWDDVSQGILERLEIGVARVNWFSTYHVHHRVAKQFRVGHSFLLGDAAHIHSPVGGQGMNTGIGDAVNLAWKLAMVLNGQAAEELLDTYAPERMAFAQRLVATTDRAFTFASRDSELARFMRVDVVPHVLPAIFSYDAARRYLFRTISQVLVHYPNSSLSAGRAGEVHGGDRLPWAGSNFAALTSLAWQVHVYGAASSRLIQFCREQGLPLHAFPWSAEADSAGLARDALYLVRPDGYVALADPTGDAARLAAYLKERRLLGISRISAIQQ
jgi:2-polyprenyl-6-methoxyphenol hydroxylase-like FAD-dependent oxidoreductase